jgi:hypothetical protein
MLSPRKRPTSMASTYRPPSTGSPHSRPTRASPGSSSVHETPGSMGREPLHHPRLLRCGPGGYLADPGIRVHERRAAGSARQQRGRQSGRVPAACARGMRDDDLRPSCHGTRHHDQRAGDGTHGQHRSSRPARRPAPVGCLTNPGRSLKQRPFGTMAVLDCPRSTISHPACVSPRHPRQSRGKPPRQLGDPARLQAVIANLNR